MSIGTLIYLNLWFHNKEANVARSPSSAMNEVVHSVFSCEAKSHMPTSRVFIRFQSEKKYLAAVILEDLDSIHTMHSTLPFRYSSSENPTRV